MYYKDVNPTPELIMAGKWNKKSSKDSHCVDFDKLSYFAPFDSSPQSEAIRMHEYGHVRFSPFTIEPGLSEQEKLLLGALEDHRSNELTTRAGLSVEAIGRVKINKDILKDMSILIPLYLSSKHYKGATAKAIEEAALTLPPPVKEILDESLKRIIDNVHDDTIPVEEARKIAKLFKGGGGGGSGKEKGKGEGKGDSKGKPDGKGEGGADAKSLSDMADRIEAMSEAEKAALRDAVLAMHEKGTHSLTDQHKSTKFIPAHGRGTIVKHPLVNAPKKLNIHKASGKKAGYDGMCLRHTERVLTDKRVFSVKSKRGVISLLLDYSGSMSLSKEDIYDILKHFNGATIALYHGSGDGGTIEIVARNGKVSKKIPRSDGGNVVDLDGLKWLSKQRAPRIWMCDGGVTGCDDRGGQNISEDCAQLAMHINAVRVNRMETLIASVHNGTLSKAIKSNKAFINRIKSGAYRADSYGREEYLSVQNPDISDKMPAHLAAAYSKKRRR